MNSLTLLWVVSLAMLIGFIIGKLVFDTDSSVVGYLEIDEQGEKDMYRLLVTKPFDILKSKKRVTFIVQKKNKS